jgi:hypothetical protein
VKQTTSLAGCCSACRLSVLLSHLPFTFLVNWTTQYTHATAHLHTQHAVLARVAYVAVEVATAQVQSAFLILGEREEAYDVALLSLVDVVTDGQSAYPSWCRAPLWGP